MAKPQPKQSTRSHDIKTEVLTITPEIAEDMLGRNTHNRRVRQSWVRVLAGRISRGEWILNGEAIRFSKSGKVLDGQHRLYAVIEADTPITSLVIHDLPDEPEVQESMDDAARRSLKDHLDLRGIERAAAVAPTLNYFYRWQVADQVRSPSVKPSTPQAIELLAEHPGLHDSVAATAKTQRRFHLSGGMLAATHYVLSSLDSASAEQFFHKLTYGEGLEAGNPILILRQYLEAQVSAGAGARANVTVHQAMIIKAWNFWGQEMHVDRITWKSSGMKAEAFPEPQMPKWVK